MKILYQAKRTLLAFMLIVFCIEIYAQKESFHYDDSTAICPLANKELIDTCYNLLERNIMLETNGQYGQIAVIDATTSEVLAWASLEKQFDGECEWCGDLVYVPFEQNVCTTDIFVPFIAAKCLEDSNTPLDKMVDTGCGILEVNDSLQIRDHNWRRGGYGKVTFEKALLMKSRIGMYKAFMTMPNGADLWEQAYDTIQKSNAIELAISFNQMYHQKSSLEYVKKIATGIFEKTGIQHRLAPRGIKLAGIYNILQCDDNKKSSDEFTFVGCFPADNPKYTIGMVVVRPHKLPVTIGMLSKEMNLLIEWLMTRKK